jgi:hypothetical protein
MDEHAGRTRPRRARRALAPALVRGFGALALLAALATAPSASAATSVADAPPPPRTELLEQALAAYQRVVATGKVANPLLTVIDYSLPSSLRRLWIVDPETRRVLAHEYVAHGRGSNDERDPARAVRFGNQPSSHRTSLGTFLTGATYTGQHGLSLELDGLDPGVNDRARERRIVIHPADYVSAAFRARTGGWIGRSWGCPALAPEVARAVIERIRGGSVLFAAAADSAPVQVTDAGL